MIPSREEKLTALIPDLIWTVQGGVWKSPNQRGREAARRGGFPTQVCCEWVNYWQEEAERQCGRMESARFRVP